MSDKGWPGVMLDLETLGTGDDAAILEIGIVAFSMPAPGLPDGCLGPELFRRVKVSSNDEAERKCSADTVAWWIKQWRAGVPMPDPEEGEDVGMAVVDAAHFIGENLAHNGKLWSRGHFDAPILGHTLRWLGMAVPWKFWQVCDMRTVCSWEGEIRTKGAAHNALEDARDQAKMLVAMARRKAWILQEAAAIASKELEMECMWKGGKA